MAIFNLITWKSWSTVFKTTEYWDDCHAKFSTDDNHSYLCFCNPSLALRNFMSSIWLANESLDSDLFALVEMIGNFRIFHCSSVSLGYFYLCPSGKHHGYWFRKAYSSTKQLDQVVSSMKMIKCMQHMALQRHISLIVIRKYK